MRKGPKGAARARRVLAACAAAAVAATAAGRAGLWLDHRTATELPPPTGPFTVGRLHDVWDDRLAVWMWYPAAGAPSVPREDYVPAPLRAAMTATRGSLISSFLTRDLAKVRPHSLREPAVSPRQPTYPVAILRGGASAEVLNYFTLAEDLASHGYVVVGLDAPTRTNVVVLPDGRVIRRLPENNGELCEGRPDESPCINRLLAAWTADIGFALRSARAAQRLGPLGPIRRTARPDARRRVRPLLRRRTGRPVLP